MAKSTLSRWVKYAIKNAYDSISKNPNRLFKPIAHELRALSTSWAYMNYIPLEEILKSAVWSSSSLFAVKAKDEVSSDSLLSKLGIQDLEMVLPTSRMRWFGHVERSTGWIAKVRKLNVVAQKRPGRPKKTWDEVLVDDRKKL